jgi:hypothetical protein
MMKTRELMNSVERIKTVLGLPNGHTSTEDLIALGRYGLGTKRSLTQLSQFIGVDFKNGQLVDNRSAAAFSSSSTD